MISQLENEITENIRAIPQVSISLLLSGGIDSSLVLALLKKVYPKIQIHTFSLARSKNYPDIVNASKVAEIFRTNHHEIILSDSEFEEYNTEYEKVKKYNYKGDVNVYILCSIAGEYSKTIVTGDGGDECFGGYWLHKYPLGHKEKGVIKSFEEIHHIPGGYLKEMVDLGFRDFLFKKKSQEEDYNTVWEYFIKVMAPKHLEPLWHTAKVLNIKVYTPLHSERLANFMRDLNYTERIGRKIEKELASKYLPKSVLDRESIGFDLALDEKILLLDHT